MLSQDIVVMMDRTCIFIAGKRVRRIELNERGGHVARRKAKQRNARP